MKTEIPDGSGTPILVLSGIGVGSLLGLTSPPAAQLADAAVGHTVLALVTLLMLETAFSAQTPSREQLRFVGVTWSHNFILSPIIATLLVLIMLPDQPLLATGVFLYLWAPCTDWFLGFTRLADGNTTIGAILVPVNMLTQLLLYPVVIYALTRNSTPWDIGEITQSLCTWFLLPVLVATAARAALHATLSTAAFNRTMKSARKAIPIALAFLVIEIFAGNTRAMVNNADSMLRILAVTLTFFVVTYLLAGAISRTFHIQYAEHALLVMTTAARNAPMMLALTTITFPDQHLTHAAITIGMLVEFPHLVALRTLLSRKRR